MTTIVPKYKVENGIPYYAFPMIDFNLEDVYLFAKMLTLYGSFTVTLDF